MIGFILNLPYTIIGLIIGFVSVPTSLSFRLSPYAIVIKVRKFWWTIAYMKKARAMTIGHVVLLGPNLEKNDLEHELVHVEQYQRLPILHLFLYQLEMFRKGYRNNKYEKEAYERAGNIYKEN